MPLAKHLLFRVTKDNSIIDLFISKTTRNWSRVSINQKLKFLYENYLVRATCWGNWCNVFPLICCSLCAQKFCCTRTFLEMTNIWKSGEDPPKKKCLHPELEWSLSPKLEKGQKKGLHPKPERFLCPKSSLHSAKMCLCNNMFVRTKLMRVHCLWNLCVRAHAHSLEGALNWCNLSISQTGSETNLATAGRFL